MKHLIDIIQEKLILSKTGYKHPEEQYFYHEALEDGYSTEFMHNKNVLQYSIDNCNTWNDLKPKTKTPEINKGERIYFKGENIEEATADAGIGHFDSDKKFNAGGNIMSLIYGDDFKGQTKLLEDYQFKCLFKYEYNLVSCEDLILPATKLTNECYSHMFFCCSSLVTAPELPAIELVNWCYFAMFNNCESLKVAPKLIATKLVYCCYKSMFSGCTSLNEITMLATDISVKNCLAWFANNLSNNGTFTKAKGVDIKFGKDGIPEGWTVKEI